MIARDPVLKGFKPNNNISLEYRLSIPVINKLTRDLSSFTNSRRFEFIVPAQDSSSLWNSKGVACYPELEVNIDRLACGDSVTPSPGVTTYRAFTRCFNCKLYVETLKLLLRNKRSNLVKSQ